MIYIFAVFIFDSPLGRNRSTGWGLKPTTFNIRKPVATLDKNRFPSRSDRVVLVVTFVSLFPRVTFNSGLVVLLVSVVLVVSVVFVSFAGGFSTTGAQASGNKNGIIVSPTFFSTAANMSAVLAPRRYSNS